MKIGLVLNCIVNYNYKTLESATQQSTASYLFHPMLDLLDYDNIYNYALMASNAYTIREDENWYKIPYEVTKSIALDPNGIKGYVFSDFAKKVHVVAIKGTSINWFESSQEKLLNSVWNDKFNDNLFLSCCFYKQSSIFKGNYSCDIPSEKHICSKECYKKSKDFDLNYLNIIEQIGLNLEKELDFVNDHIILQVIH
jgi:putative lipase involved disintegration of autophagic bodies